MTRPPVFSSHAINPAIRTRFAPSPTGYLHVGGARTALFSWAYARKLGGTFILRIEDTDVERSTEASVQAILQGMAWLGLTHDEGPFYQMQRMPRYKEVIAQLLASGHAYHCYTSKEELEQMRQAQEAQGLKPRYDGTWRPEAGKTLPPIPADVTPVVRFKNPTQGAVTWHDLVKGEISISNGELDDLIIARGDGTPTYNFCVVVDDWDMQISHVIRGDDHVNNTPRQINILQALGATIPQYAHLPMILGGDGTRLSKRHGAVSVMSYAEEGYLPEAMRNYLARLGWGHGDDEIFSTAQFVEWFDLSNLSNSAAQFDVAKLQWLNNHYLKQADAAVIAEQIREQVEQTYALTATSPDLVAAVALMKERAHTLQELVAQLALFYAPTAPSDELLATHVTPDIQPALHAVYIGLQDLAATQQWHKAAISTLIKTVVKAHGIKMPQLAMPIRLLVTGQLQTPSIDAVLELLGAEVILQRLKK
jgi:glutamyl-tRNA synthetase